FSIARRTAPWPMRNEVSTGTVASEPVRTAVISGMAAACGSTLRAGSSPGDDPAGGRPAAVSRDPTRTARSGPAGRVLVQQCRAHAGHVQHADQAVAVDDGQVAEALRQHRP